ncbi:hypothetical protein NECAME_12914 [Necator americanus]|uniref:Uncharacterized protein n=1 Tax=Necator americanus TaxID=51031 RepID=W2SYD8_NECAM|nr:hypothetical protein NECAME_12914 [Necator americanus]ETN74553.1 hypothetical protein NECAME_12914 [Necator americanus]
MLKYCVVEPEIFYTLMVSPPPFGSARLDSAPHLHCTSVEHPHFSDEVTTKFKRHCAAAEFLQDADWMLVIDENTAVANPDHCIEEWIDDRVNVLLFEQFTDWDISSSSYLVRNSQWSIQFLHKLAQWEFSSTPGKDNFEVIVSTFTIAMKEEMVAPVVV